MSRIITRKQDGTMPTRLERWRATRGRVHYGITLANFTTLTEALIPANDTFDKNPAGKNYEDKATTVKAHTTLVVKNGANTLTLNTDYTLADNVVTLKKEYLATLSVGDVALSVILDDVPNTYTVTVEDTTV